MCTNFDSNLTTFQHWIVLFVCLFVCLFFFFVFFFCFFLFFFKLTKDFPEFYSYYFPTPPPLLLDYLALLLQKGAQQELTMATLYNAEVK